MSDFVRGRGATQYLTKKELAELLRCSERTVDRLLETEGLPVIQLSKRRIIFSAASAERCLEGRVSGATAPSGRRRKPAASNQLQKSHYARTTGRAAKGKLP
jgi:excisionase family DNA binding protein